MITKRIGALLGAGLLILGLISPQLAVTATADPDQVPATATTAAPAPDPMTLYGKYTKDPTIAAAMVAAAAATTSAQKAVYPGFIAFPPMPQYWCGMFKEEDCVKYFGAPPEPGHTYCGTMPEAECVALVQRVQVEERYWFQAMYQAIADNNKDAMYGPTAWCGLTTIALCDFYYGPQPGTQPATPPVTEPTQPAAEPTQPAAEPTPAEPTQTAAEPTQPAAEPAVPPTEPTQPAAEPTQTTAPPPSTPPADPATPSDTPEVVAPVSSAEPVATDAAAVDPLTLYGRYTSDPTIAAAMAQAAADTIAERAEKYPGYINMPQMTMRSCGLYIQSDCAKYFDPNPPPGQQSCKKMSQADCNALLERVRAEENRWYQALWTAINKNNNEAYYGQNAACGLATELLCKRIYGSGTANTPPSYTPPAFEMPAPPPAAAPPASTTAASTPLVATEPTAAEIANAPWCGLMEASDCDKYFGPKPAADAATWCGLADDYTCSTTYWTALNEEMAAMQADAESSGLGFAAITEGEVAGTESGAAPEPVDPVVKYAKYTSDPTIAQAMAVLFVKSTSAWHDQYPNYIDDPEITLAWCGMYSEVNCVNWFGKRPPDNNWCRGPGLNWDKCKAIIDEVSAQERKWYQILSQAIWDNNVDARGDDFWLSWKEFYEKMTDPRLINWDYVYTQSLKGVKFNMSIDMNSPAAQAGMAAAQKKVWDWQQQTKQCGLMSELDCRMYYGLVSKAEWDQINKECCSGGKSAGPGLGPNGGGNPDGTNYCCMDGWGADMLHKEYVHKWELLAYVHTTQPYSGGQLIGIGTNTSNVYMEIVKNPYYIGKPWETPIVQAT